MEIENKKDMYLESPSGFMMPFACAEEEEVVVTLGYGQQTHPRSGESFYHYGLDFVADHVPLYAVASGTVIGVGTEAVHENYIVCRYGKYEVRYAHISEAYPSYGQKVEAGQLIAVSGDFLHLDVKFEGKEIDPRDFLTMLLTNILHLESMGIKTFPHQPLLGAGVDIKTSYDNDQEEITHMMLQYMPRYMQDLSDGKYRFPKRTEQTLRNVFAQSSSKNYFFENIPDMSNPLGLSNRAVPMVSKVQDIMIGDFLNYMATRHNKYVSTWSEAQKKNFLTSQEQKNL